MLNLLLLDADVIISLHELGLWDALVKQANIYIASTVVNVEALYYPDKKSKKDEPINLLEYLSNGQIKILKATVDEQRKIVSELKRKKLKIILPDPGELEAMAIINEKKIDEIKFCTIDTLAMEAMIHLNFADQVVSFEEVLRSLGLIRKTQKINDYGWSKKKLKDLRTKIILGLY